MVSLPKRRLFRVLRPKKKKRKEKKHESSFLLRASSGRVNWRLGSFNTSIPKSLLFEIPSRGVKFDIYKSLRSLFFRALFPVLKGHFPVYYQLNFDGTFPVYYQVSSKHTPYTMRSRTYTAHGSSLSHPHRSFPWA